MDVVVFNCYPKQRSKNSPSHLQEDVSKKREEREQERAKRRYEREIELEERRRKERNGDR